MAKPRKLELVRLESTATKEEQAIRLARLIVVLLKIADRVDRERVAGATEVTPVETPVPAKVESHRKKNRPFTATVDLPDDIADQLENMPEDERNRLIVAALRGQMEDGNGKSTADV